jgi:hypothetical protein
VACSRHCLQQYGAVLHHNLDKLGLRGGHCRIGLGARMPGDRAWAHRAAALRDAIELDDADLAALTAAGQPEVPAPPEWAAPHPVQPITLRSRSVLVEHSIGLLQLAVIIAHPSQEIPAIQLVAGVEAITDNGGSAQPVLDREAASEYRRRLSQLGTTIDAQVDAAELDQPCWDPVILVPDAKRTPPPIHHHYQWWPDPRSGEVGTYRAGLLAKRRPVRHAHRLWRNRSGRWPAVMRSGSRG